MNSTLTKSILDRFLVKRNLNLNLRCERSNLYLFENLDKYKISLKINRNSHYTSNDSTNYKKELQLNLIEVKRNQLSGFKQQELIHLEHEMTRKHFIIDEFNISDYTNKRKRSTKSNAFKGYLSASKVRNFLIEDPFLDYLRMFGPDKIESNYEFTEDKFTQNIMNKGIEFEDEVMEMVKSNLSHLNIQQVCYNVDDVHNMDNIKVTIDHMKNGVDVIYQGLLVDKKNKLYGSPDLIIKNTVLNDFFPELVYENTEGCKFLDNEHYVICDIKSSTIHMNSDDTTMRNSGSMKAFKGQLYIYQSILNDIQETDNNVTIIWAKNKRNDNSKFGYHTNDLEETYGIIDYGNKDKRYIELVDKAVKWLRELKTNGSSWELYPTPSHTNLYPNMKNDMNGKYKDIKKKYAKDIEEITMVYHCGVKRRKTAHSKGIYKLSDKKLNSSILGFKDTSKIGNIVDHILKVNQSQHKILPRKVTNNLFDWRTPSDLEIFIDFETLNSVVDGVDKTRIFMIGIGYNYHGKYEEKCYVMKNNTRQGEIDMFDEFYNHVEKLEEEFDCQARYFHWYDAEPIFYRKFMSRTKDLDFRDLEKVFRTEPICIKNCYNFKLKSVATSMYNHGMIETCWDSDSECSDGRLAMILAGELYVKYVNNSSMIESDAIMKDIIRYNMIDVKVLYEILEYLRHNH